MFSQSSSYLSFLLFLFTFYVLMFDFIILLIFSFLPWLGAKPAVVRVSRDQKTQHEALGLQGLAPSTCTRSRQRDTKEDRWGGLGRRPSLPHLSAFCCVGASENENKEKQKTETRLTKTKNTWRTIDSFAGETTAKSFVSALLCCAWVWSDHFCAWGHNWQNCEVRSFRSVSYCEVLCWVWL